VSATAARLTALDAKARIAIDRTAHSVRTNSTRLVSCTMSEIEDSGTGSRCSSAIHSVHTGFVMPSTRSPAFHTSQFPSARLRA